MMPIDPLPVWNADRLRASTFVAHVELHDQLDSTNDRALALANDPNVELPCLVIADRQTQGRGRGGNLWWSSAGALTCSLLLELDAEHLPTSRWPEMSLTVGSSVCAALSRRLPGEDVRLKWPNDVYLRGAKVCGVLVEVPHTGFGMRDTGSGPVPASRIAHHASRVVIGIGVNVNNSVEGAPDEVRQRAIALCDVGGAQPVGEVLIDILREFARQLQQLGSDPEATRTLWRRFDLLTGQTVTIDEGVRPLTGTCVGIEDDGALLLQTESGPRRCYGGVVQSFT